MNDQFAPLSHDKIPTLVEHQHDGWFVIAFCPICDLTKEAADGQGREQATTAAVAKIKSHLRTAHRLKPAQMKISLVTRPRKP